MLWYGGASTSWDSHNEDVVASAVLVKHFSYYVHTTSWWGQCAILNLYRRKVYLGCLNILIDKRHLLHLNRLIHNRFLQTCYGLLQLIYLFEGGNGWLWQDRGVMIGNHPLTILICVNKRVSTTSLGAICKGELVDSCFQKEHSSKLLASSSFVDTISAKNIKSIQTTRTENKDPIYSDNYIPAS